MTFASVNPAKNQLNRTFDAHTRAETAQTVERAHIAFGRWRETGFDERQRISLRLAASLRNNELDLATLITQDMGKRIAESRSEIEYCAKICEFYAKHAEQFLADQRMPLEDADAYLRHEPLGVILGVMPWNFPFYQVVRFATPNIMCGNTVLIKHAPNVPQCAAKLAELFAEAGLPEGVYNNLFVPVDVVESIIADGRVRGVSLTGSERAGSAVAAVAGKHLKRSVLELGGNDPFIVLEDADLDHTVEMAVRGRMVNTGQSCVASKRFIVVEPLAAAFLSAFKERMAKLKMGDPMEPDTDVAPLSTEAAAKRLTDQVQKSCADGATVVLGGDRPDRPGAYFNPTILTDVKPGMAAYDQELFGPVACVYVVADEEAAIALANDSSYGLGGSVYTRDVERGRRVAERVETGMMYINQPTRSQAELPFGGIKNSGYGRELSHLGILEFVNKKLIHCKK